MPDTSRSKFVLVPRAGGAGPGVRRYRLARLALNPPASPRDGYEHLKRTYD